MGELRVARALLLERAFGEVGGPHERLQAAARPPRVRLGDAEDVDRDDGREDGGRGGVETLVLRRGGGPLPGEGRGDVGEGEGRARSGAAA